MATYNDIKKIKIGDNTFVFHVPTASEVGALPSSTTIPAITLNGTANTSPSFYAPTTAGTNGYVLKSNGSGAPTWTSATLTDTKVTTAALTSGTLYYPILATGTGTATRQIDSTLKGLTYKSTAGTTSTVGSALLVLGNDIAEGTANNEEGQLALYGPSGKYEMIVCNPSANRIITLPDQTGTLVTTNDILDIMYPIGSIYETTDINFDPNVKWGGYWISETLTDNKIVEEGMTNDWTYRKWSSGIAECWKTWTSASFSPATSVGGFYGRVLPASGTFSLPSGLFVTAPIMSVNLTEWGSGYFWGSARAVTSTSFKMTLFRNDNASSDGVAKIYATGTWKTYEAPFPIYKWTRLD